MEMKGMKNKYTCTTCGRSIITINAHDGTTPFMMRCRATARCSGDMRSHFYKVNQHAFAAWEWYRPGKQEKKRIRKNKQWGRDIMDHVDQGGLLLRRRGQRGGSVEEAAS